MCPQGGRPLCHVPPSNVPRVRRLPARRFSVGERQAAISTDPFMNSVSAIRVFNIAEDPREMLEVRPAATGLRSGVLCATTLACCDRTAQGVLCATTLAVAVGKAACCTEVLHGSQPWERRTQHAPGGPPRTDAAPLHTTAPPAAADGAG